MIVLGPRQRRWQVGGPPGGRDEAVPRDLSRAPRAGRGRRSRCSRMHLRAPGRTRPVRARTGAAAEVGSSGDDAGAKAGLGQLRARLNLACSRRRVPEVKGRDQQIDPLGASSLTARSSGRTMHWMCGRSEGMVVGPGLAAPAGRGELASWGEADRRTSPRFLQR